MWVLYVILLNIPFVNLQFTRTYSELMQNYNFLIITNPTKVIVIVVYALTTKQTITAELHNLGTKGGSVICQICCFDLLTVFTMKILQAVSPHF